VTLRTGRPLNRFVLYLAPLLFKGLMVSIMGSCPVRRVGAETIEDYKSRGQPWLYCSWHNNIAMGICRLRNQQVAMMASASRDGDLIARAIEALGNISVRGSSSFRGSQAARDMLRVVRQGHSGAISPDGPRGPPYQCQPGAVWVAALTGCPLVPYHLEASRQWRAASWDRHKIPKPFATIHEYFGEPMYVRREEIAGGTSGAVTALQRHMVDNTLACLRGAGHEEEIAALSA